jgi:hypothetical protein
MSCLCRRQSGSPPKAVCRCCKRRSSVLPGFATSNGSGRRLCWPLLVSAGLAAPQNNLQDALRTTVDVSMQRGGEVCAPSRPTARRPANPLPSALAVPCLACYDGWSAVGRRPREMFPLRRSNRTSALWASQWPGPPRFVPLQTLPIPSLNSFFLQASSHLRSSVRPPSRATLTAIMSLC